jgi:hypothetical protein
MTILKSLYENEMWLNTFKVAENLEKYHRGEYAQQRFKDIK